MDVDEIVKVAELEDRHWWYAERRYLLARTIRHLPPGRVIDIGAAAGGNTRVLQRLGWSAVAIERDHDGAILAHERDITTVRGDATRLPIRDESVHLVVAYDVLEHIDDDSAATHEFYRVLRPGGHVAMAVPAGMDLWSAHDEALGHVRRYEPDSLRAVIEGAGLAVTELRYWNVLLRPIVRWRRRKTSESDLTRLNPLLNTGLRSVVAAERYLPVSHLRGVSLLLVAVKN